MFDGILNNLVHFYVNTHFFMGYFTGRMFNHQVLDMFELGADNYKSFESFKNAKTTMGNKPCLIFNGGEWDGAPEHSRLKNFFIGKW